jgi:hypothetical protein
LLARNRARQLHSTHHKRRPNILRHCEQYIKDLAELYEATDPARGLRGEEGKLEAARQAISIWWLCVPKTSSLLIA